MTTTTHAAPQARPGSTLSVWTPEDKAFWDTQGQAVAKLNLWISVPALFLAFAVWQLWSVVAVNLPQMGFQYSTNQLFWLAAAPALSGATLRIFYSFMVPVFGGRRWTAISTASLLIPALGIGFAVQDNTTAYPTMLILAWRLFGTRTVTPYWSRELTALSVFFGLVTVGLFFAVDKPTAVTYWMAFARRMLAIMVETSMNWRRASALSPILRRSSMLACRSCGVFAASRLKLRIEYS